MNKLTVYSLRASLAFSVAVSALATPALAGGAPPNIGGLFGAILNNALAQQNRQLWTNRPVAEYNCLEAHNTSAEILANSGIGPNDPRVQRMFMKCAQDNAASPAIVVTPGSSAATGVNNPNFAIEGLAVGASVTPESAAYKAYKCRPSTDYPGFQWCGRHRSMKGSTGPYDEYMTIFHSDAYQTVFMLQDIIPAFFAAGDVDREIQRLSKRFGQSPHVFSGEPHPEAPHSIIAVWGDVVLTPLDIDNVEALRRGETIHAGLVVDFLGDSKKSAVLGMPIFQIGGGAGYIWSAKYDDSGKGRLRITPVNAALLPGAAPEPAPPMAYAPPTPERTPTIDPAKLEAERAAHAERAIAAADRQLQDAQAFIRKNPQSPQLLDYVDHMGALAAAEKTGDPTSSIAARPSSRRS